jgi:hypothetical protein
MGWLAGQCSPPLVTTELGVCLLSTAVWVGAKLAPNAPMECSLRHALAIRSWPFGANRVSLRPQGAPDAADFA